MSVHGPSVPSRRVHPGAAKPGVHRADEVAFLDSTSRAPEVESITTLLSLPMKMLAGDVQMQHLVLVHDAQPAQDLVEEGTGWSTRGTTSRFAARGDDEPAACRPAGSSSPCERSRSRGRGSAPRRRSGWLICAGCALPRRSLQAPGGTAVASGFPRAVSSPGVRRDGFLIATMWRFRSPRRGGDHAESRASGCQPIWQPPTTVPARRGAGRP